MVARCSSFWFEPILDSICFLLKHWAWDLADPSRHNTLIQRRCFRQTDRKAWWGAGRDDRLDGRQKRTDRQEDRQSDKRKDVVKDTCVGRVDRLDWRRKCGFGDDLSFLGTVNLEIKIVNTCIISWYLVVRELKQVYLFWVSAIYTDGRFGLLKWNEMLNTAGEQSPCQCMGRGITIRMHEIDSVLRHPNDVFLKMKP